MPAYRLINCTPHAIHIFPDDEWQHQLWIEGVKQPGAPLTIEPSGTVPRVEEVMEPDPLGDLIGIEARRVTYGRVADLPDEQGGVIYIVSRIIAQAVPDRRDLVFPVDFVRDEAGRILGSRALGRFAS